MTQFHRTTQPKTRWLLAFLIGAITLQACSPAVPASTPIPTLEPGSTTTPVPSATSSPSPSSTPTETPTVTPEPMPELFAGFTKNPDIPFILFHQNGENLAVLDSVGPSASKGVIWTSPDGESSIVVYTDSDGMPESAVVGDDVVFYSNFTDETVDLTIVHPDGSQEIVQAERNTEVLNKLDALAVPPFKFVSYPLGGEPSYAQADTLELIKIGAKIMGAAFCISAIAGSGGVTLPILIGPCLGTILTVITSVGQALGLHVEVIEDLSYKLSIFKCPFFLKQAAEGDLSKISDLAACISAAATALQQIQELAAETNQERARWIQHGSFMPELTEPPAVGALEGIVNAEQAYCRYGPAKAYLPAGDLFKGDRVSIEGRNYGSSWLWVQPENLDRHCWAAASVFEINGEVSTAEIVQPQLPFTPDSDMVTGLRASRDGNMVTFRWNPSTLAPEDFRGYLVEALSCENGVNIWQVLNPMEPTITIRDDKDCSQPASGVIYTASVRGYSQSVPIPWPK